jgi:hypothetical protein
MTPSKTFATFIVIASLLFVRPARADDAPAGGASAFNLPTSALIERQEKRLRNQQQFLSSLWIFASLNYLYCDVAGLMDSKMLRQYLGGEIDGFKINESFLFGATILMQVPLSMVFLSTALSPRASRIANISAGAFMTAVQTATLFLGKPSKYYALSSGIEIATTGFITAYALFAMKPMKVVPLVEPQPGGVTLKAGFRF